MCSFPQFTYNPASADLVSCILTSNVQCPELNPATSITVVTAVNTSLPAAITIAASVNPFCPGSQITFTATPGNDGTTPTFQWIVNGSNTGRDSPSNISSKGPGQEELIANTGLFSGSKMMRSILQNTGFIMTLKKNTITGYNYSLNMKIPPKILQKPAK